MSPKPNLPVCILDLQGVLVASPVGRCFGVGAHVNVDEWSLTGPLPPSDENTQILVDEATAWVLAKMGRTDVCAVSETLSESYAKAWAGLAWARSEPSS